MSKLGEGYNVLVVGAGGIGCELLKNLVYSGFKKLSLIDLDTIDVSNLNRQFLFRKIHVGKSKAEVASESIKQLRNDVELTPYHASIFSSRFNDEFFKQFDIVFSALDNQAARRHINRMCVYLNKPIIESGTAGYLGQVEPLVYAERTPKGPQAPCFECTPRANDRRTYPTCTIRNTPSEPVHCVVWAKFLFNQLFGEADFENEEVSPDMDDPEAQNSKNHQDDEKPEGNSSLWSRTADSCDGSISPEESLALRLFNRDISTLLSMRSLWVDHPDRREPCPLDACTLKAARAHPGLDGKDGAEGLRDQRQMSLEGWISLFLSSTRALRGKAGLEDPAAGDHKPLVWDKDDRDAMDFVAAASIIRAILFHVPGAKELTRFTVKSFAGNIIPAIATTNAIIAGAMVLQALNVLQGRIDAVRTVFLHRQPAGFGRFLAPCRPVPPNPNCLVCSGAQTQELRLHCDPAMMRLIHLKENVLIKHLGMIAPDVEIEGKGIILISSDGDETEDIEQETLLDFNLTGQGCPRLRCDDFRQNMTFYLRIVSSPRSRDNSSWCVEGEYESLDQEAAKETDRPESPPTGSKRTRETDDSDIEEVYSSDDNSEPSQPSKVRKLGLDDGVVEGDKDEEIVMLD
ncbi:SUMO activating enzyme subunit 2 [Echinococcus multilocularis]|uniref:SUMO-activating enzyme subunit n=1 Tax=Echinococcus multilocularis TaxID=6211 RepID=A0A068YNS2_ECHMU|nr:SUMO activating enzyme subunit 2 [Echinococcus multilocularis]